MACSFFVLVNPPLKAQRAITDYHRSICFMAFNNFACHARIADHALSSVLLTEFTQVLVKASPNGSSGVKQG